MGSTVTSARVAGALLVERGIVTPAQFVEALEHQRAHGSDLEEALEKVAGVSREDVLAVVNDRDGAARVDIGMILLAGGAVDEDNLVAARERSAATGQPVGPILVEMGAITRLDLASALAEQWSDSPAQILPPPNARERPVVGDGESVEDLRFAMAALEASVRASRESGDDAGMLEELLSREAQLAARIVALEHAIDQPVEADPALVAEIQAMGEGLEALQTSLRSVASSDDVAAVGSALEDLAQVRASLAGLEQRIEGVASAVVVEAALAEAAELARRISQLEAGDPQIGALAEEVAALAGRPLVDPQLVERVDELGRAVEALGVLAEASSGADGLHDAIAGLAARVDEAAAVAPRVEELAAALDALRASVVGIGEAVARLPAVESAAERVGALTSELDELRSTLAEVAGRPVADEGLGARLEEVSAALEGALAELRGRVDELAGRPPGDDDLRGAVDALAGSTESSLAGLAERVDELAERAQPDPSLPTRLDALEATLADLAAGVARADTAPGTIGAHDARGDAARLEALEAALADTRAALDDLREDPPVAPDAQLRVDRLEHDVTALLADVAAVPVLTTEIAEIAGRLGGLEALGLEIASLRESVIDLESLSRDDGDLATRVEQLAARVEALSVEALGPAAEAAVAGVAERVERLAAAQTEGGTRAEELRERLDALREELARDGAEAAAALEGRIAALAGTLDGLAARVDSGDGTAEVAALAAAVADLQALRAPTESRLDDLQQRLVSVETRVDDAQRDADDAFRAVHERLEAVSVEAQAHLATLLERLAAVEARPPDGTGGDDVLRAEVTSLGERVEELRSSVTAELARLEAARAEERAALEELRATRTPAAEGSGPGVTDGGSAVPPSAPELAKLARDLERLSDRVVEQERSLVEHFARRERALMERLGAGNDIGQRLSDMARAIEEVRERAERAGTGAGGVGDAELEALRDAVFKRLERLASSIDWRFQRLEGGPAAAAGRTDLTARVEQLARVVEQLAQVEGIGDVDLGAAPSGDVYLALVPTATGNHQLVELHGDTPETGETIPAPFGRGELLVVAVGTSPLPGDDRACVFVQPADQPAHA